MSLNIGCGAGLGSAIRTQPFQPVCAGCALSVIAERQTVAKARLLTPANHCGGHCLQVSQPTVCAVLQHFLPSLHIYFWQIYRRHPRHRGDAGVADFLGRRSWLGKVVPASTQPLAQFTDDVITVAKQLDIKDQLSVEQFSVDDYLWNVSREGI